jgi:3-deoxy-manno-octulosonate cytidylyltransferase (CMP-KDO synthetase)
MARVLAVIPSRYGSTRLPGKPLLPMLGGDPMIAHVVRRARAARTVDRVIVATDHEGIAAAAERAGAEAVMTDGAIGTGTDRVAEALRLSGAAADIVVNVQGDEPLIEPRSIDLAARLLLTHEEADMATLSAPLPAAALLDPHKVKVVCSPMPQPPHADPAAWALFFSRAPIGVERSALIELLRPHQAGSDGEAVDSAAGRSERPPAGPHACRLHVGLYAFRPPALRRFVSLPPAPLELLESLEQLRALQGGMRIVVGEVAAGAQGVDTMEDLCALEEQWHRSRQTRAAAFQSS